MSVLSQVSVNHTLDFTRSRRTWDFKLISVSLLAPEHLYYPYKTDNFRKLYPLLKVIIQPFFTFKLPSSIFTIP